MNNLISAFLWLIKVVFSFDFPGGSYSKESACSAGDPGSVPESGTSPREGNGTPLQYPCLENPMDRRAWQALQTMGSKESDMTEQLTHTHILKLGKLN